MGSIRVKYIVALLAITAMTGAHLVHADETGAPPPAAVPPPAAPAGSPSATVHPHSTLAQQATNPVAPLIQLRFQNYFVVDSIYASGYANVFDVQTVIPVKKMGFLPRAVFRPTIPVVTTPDVGAVNGTTGLGDIDYVYIYAFDQDWGVLGTGPAGAVPSATDRRLGARKWTLGPSIFGMYTGIPSVQLGSLLFNTWSLGGSGANDVNELSLQLIATKHWGKGWFAGWGDQAMSFNWEKSGQAYVPLSFRLGKVLAIGKQHMEFDGQYIYNVGAEIPGQDQWGFKLTVNFLFPQK